MDVKILVGIAAAISAGIILSVILLNEDSVESQTIQPILETPKPVLADPVTSLYRVNTQCEVLYGMFYNEYPNGEPLQQVSLSEIVQKYRSDFAQWDDILFDETKRVEFFKDGMPFEFSKVFVYALMKEYSINPELHSTVMLGFYEEEASIANDIMTENNCIEQFENFGS